MQYRTRTPRFPRILALAALALALAVAAGGCKRNAAPLEGPQGTMAVAGFAQPRSTAQLLGGYIPEDETTVQPKVLTQLDIVLMDELSKATGRTLLGPPAVRQCAETVLASEQGSGRAFDHWLAVGRCLDVDWLLVPQLTVWRERQGSDVSVREPASVTLSLYLLDVRGESFAWRYRFEETQQPLTANFLDAGKFIDRGGKWISALDLAREGLAQGVKELGL